jgi:dihydrofolate synthase/folylpolyglutamate synthase
MPFQKIEQVSEYFAAHMSGQYSRVNFDAFLTAIGFRYAVPSIHITGTNGKGSTATMIQNIYQCSGRRVGLFTSPSFERFSEMIYIDDDEIDERYVLAFMNKYETMFAQYQLTTFEIQTFMALSYFADQKVALAVIEVGMGGRLDATNVFTPVLSIITNIGLEHTGYLGPTLVDIAGHKAGIIKPKVPVLIGKLDSSCGKVVEDAARANDAPLIKASEPYEIKTGISQYFSYGSYQNLELTMNGTFQITNATVAVEATNLLAKRWPIKEKDVRAGLYRTFMPGRLEIVGSNPMVIIDGAHNPHGVQALVRSISPFTKKMIFVIFAAFKDKDVEPMLKELQLVSSRITVTSFNHPRARHQSDYQNLAYPYIDDFKVAVARIYENAPRSSVILITGSLAFAGMVRAFIQSGGLPH